MEEEKEKTSPRKPGLDPIYIVRFTFWLVLVLALGFLALNYGFQFFYGVHLLKAPCDLCGELNPEVQDCIDNLNSPRPSFYTGKGSAWSDPFKETYINFTIEP